MRPRRWFFLFPVLIACAVSAGAQKEDWLPVSLQDLRTKEVPGIPGAGAFGGPTAVLAGAGIGSDHLLFTSDLNIRTADGELTYQWGDRDCLVRASRC